MEPLSGAELLSHMVSLLVGFFMLQVFVSVLCLYLHILGPFNALRRHL